MAKFRKAAAREFLFTLVTRDVGEVGGTQGVIAYSAMREGNLMAPG